MKFFHSLETPNLKDNFFLKKRLIKFLPKTLIISGGSEMAQFGHFWMVISAISSWKINF